MPNDRKSLTQYLDYFLPFLEAAPGWFKVWVYVLIALICATAAAASYFYLETKDRQLASRSSAAFQITTPKEGDEIPIRETKGSWLVRGRFPTFETPGSDSAANTSVTVRVERLPDLEPIPQTLGSIDGPTADGFWSAKVVFSSDGNYRIVATGKIDKQPPLVREVTVQCIGKVSALRRRMQKDRDIRKARPIPDRPPAALDKSFIIPQVSDLQSLLYETFAKGDWAQALPLVVRTLDLIDPALLHSPDDILFQNIRAYFFKNYAIIMEKMGNKDEFSRALLESEAMFKAILEQNEKDPSAWNGIGSVLLTRGQPEEALYYIRKALEYHPNYPEAKHDELLALDMINKKTEQTAAPMQ